MKKLIVFSDLDGTLLDHHSYDWSAAETAINALRDRQFPLILNSSKTSSEINSFRKAMNNSSPYICENGSVVHYFDSTGVMKSLYFAKPYDDLRQALNTLRDQHHYKVTGFGDMDTETLMQITGLDKTSAIAALKREATEPLLWQDTEEALKDFTTQVTEQHLQLTRGGRFYHLMSPVNKGDSIKFLIEQYQQMEPETTWVSVGLGDSFNDIAMLEQVDYPVLIKNPDSKKPDLHHLPNLIESDLPGPAGWNTEILNIIEATQE